MAISVCQDLAFSVRGVLQASWSVSFSPLGEHLRVDLVEQVAHGGGDGC